MTAPNTPPPELLNEWRTQGRCQDYCSTNDYVAACSAQWGYDQRGKVNEAELQEARDQELEACCEWLADETPTNYINALRAARRPKPPSLKEQALMALEDGDTGLGVLLTPKEVSTIRRALEQLNDD